MSEELARVVSIVSIVFTVASLALAIVFARKKTRIRVGFDLARAIIGVLAILLMAAVTGVVTSTLAVLLAVVGGLVLGFGQGSKLEITRDEKGFHARRTPVAIALWGVGIVIMQAAGLASRAGVVRLGQTIAWFSACLGIGLMAGRTGPIRRTAAGAGVAAAIIAVVLPTAFMVGAEVPVAAQSITLTDDQVCDLTPVSRNPYPGLHPGEYNEFTFEQAYNPSLPGTSETAPGTAVAGCLSADWSDYSALPIDFFVYLFASDDEAIARVQYEISKGNEWFAGWIQNAGGWYTDERRDSSRTFNSGGLNDFGVGGAWYSVMGNEDRVVMQVGSFLLYGVADNTGFELGEKDAYGFRRPITLIETLITPMLETVGNIETLLDEPAPPPSETSPTAPTTAPTPTTAPAEGTNVPTTVGTTETTVTPPGSDGGGASGPDSGGSDEPIDPEKAATQAITGLIAAVAIGLITWGEATAEIAKILGGLPDRDGATGTIPTDFIDPLDGTPLESDPDTGQVWWPWDGGDGRWVDPSAVPGLVDDWNRELDAETTRRVAAHDAQRDQNWADLQDRIRRSEADAEADAAAEQARLGAFDRRVDVARKWMEEGDADSLGQLDRIIQRVADQGYATDADIERARTSADRSRTWVSTKRQWDAEDEIRITNNRNTVLEITAKGFSALIDPTKGWVSGAIWGAVESWDRGDSIGAVAGNAIFESGLARAGRAIDTWAPGRAALGNTGWGAVGSGLWSGVETAVRGGTTEQVKTGVMTGFAVGGLGGVAEEIGTIGTRPTADLPTIHSRTGGPRVGYDAPSRPSLRPPERGGVGAMPQRTPTIHVRPGDPSPHYDHPTSPRHVDPQDPRYLPPDTPADQVHTPPSDWSKPPRGIIEPEGPLGARPPSEPPTVSPTDAFDGPPPVKPPSASPPARTPIEPRVVPDPEGPIPGSASDWSKPPPRFVEPEGPLGGRPPSDPSPVSPVDATGKPPLGDLPDRMPPTPEQLSRLAEGARPTRPAADILDDMMTQPRHPAGTGGPSVVENWQRGFFPDQSGRGSMIDTEGRVTVDRRVGSDAEGWPVIEKRHIGNVDPETGTLVNLQGEPITVALDHRGVPVGYIEQPSVPPGMQPAYNARGELAGYVDGMGRADIGGERVPVAFDSQGKLVPFDAPPRATGSPVEHLPPKNLRGSSRLPGGDAEPVTAGGDLPRTPVDAPPATGEMAAPPGAASDAPIDYTPYGNPVAAGDGAAPIGLSDLDTKPRIPVLDEGGGVSHLVEPGPREIHYDAEGNPFFVQRQHPVRSTPMRDIRVSDMQVAESARPMPTPEVFDATEAWFPLSGDGAPPTAPDLIPPSPPGGQQP